LGTGAQDAKKNFMSGSSKGKTRKNRWSFSGPRQARRAALFHSYKFAQFVKFAFKLVGTVPVTVPPSR
jgi:hypothetical protein